ncbi:MAG: CsbD family protein [Acidobacteriota bacterium]
MNWDQIEGNWTQFKGKVREQWGRLTDDDIDVINGKREQLVGRVQETYGCLKEDAEKQVQDFEKKASSYFDKSGSRQATATR